MDELKYTPENITSLERDDIFVFGSNLEGRHLGGAARVALDKFGARDGAGSRHSRAVICHSYNAGRG